jgi:hypothetical protein
MSVHIHARNLIFGGLLLGSAAITSAFLVPGESPGPSTSTAAPAPDPLPLEVGVLVQRETPEGDWTRVPSRERSSSGDELQLTVRVKQEAHLMVAFASSDGHRLQVVYPLPGQTGQVRPDWAYALPDPDRSYQLDGRPTRLLVLASRDPLPTELPDRLSVLRAAQKRPARSTSSVQVEPVQLELRDGRPVSVPVRRYSSISSPVVAVIRL